MIFISPVQFCRCVESFHWSCFNDLWQSNALLRHLIWLFSLHFLTHVHVCIAHVCLRWGELKEVVAHVFSQFMHWQRSVVHRHQLIEILIPHSVEVPLLHTQFHTAQHNTQRGCTSQWQLETDWNKPHWLLVTSTKLFLKTNPYKSWKCQCISNIMTLKLKSAQKRVLSVYISENERLQKIS